MTDYCGGHCGACDEKHRDWEAQVHDLRACLEAFVIAFKEPDGGDNRPLRKYAESKGIYADDLGRDRILLRIAQAALGRP